MRDKDFGREKEAGLSTGAVLLRGREGGKDGLLRFPYTGGYLLFVMYRLNVPSLLLEKPRVPSVD